jgi:hypothetical protein
MTTFEPILVPLPHVSFDDTGTPPLWRDIFHFPELKLYVSYEQHKTVEILVYKDPPSLTPGGGGVRASVTKWHMGEGGLK